MASSTKKISWAHIFFLISGLLLVIYYLLTEGVPSVSGGNFFESVAGVIEFIASIVVIIVVIGFYCYYLFAPDASVGATKALAPALLVFTLFGKYAMELGNDTANRIITSLAEVCFTLIALCGFTFIFLRKKVLGTIFAWACLVYAVFVGVSYLTLMIMAAIDGSFDVKFLFSTMCLFFALGLMFGGGYRICRSKAWTD